MGLLGVVWELQYYTFQHLNFQDDIVVECIGTLLFEFDACDVICITQNAGRLVLRSNLYFNVSKSSLSSGSFETINSVTIWSTDLSFTISLTP